MVSYRMIGVSSFILIHETVICWCCYMILTETGLVAQLETSLHMPPTYETIAVRAQLAVVSFSAYVRAVMLIS